MARTVGIDEGGPAGPAIAPGAAAAKANQALRGRQKNSYKILTKHVLDPGHLTEMANNHFQNGDEPRGYTSRQRASSQ